jgi:hypothetical protein
MLITPFRLPRDPVEVILIPTIVDIIGTGWLAIGLTLRPPGGTTRILQRPSLVGPACALLILLIVFQFVLRPGVRF